MWSLGIPVFAAAGNDEKDGLISFPACIAGVQAVAAVHHGGSSPGRYQCNWAAHVDFAALGNQLALPDPNGGYYPVPVKGTSAATAVAAAGFVLLRRAHPDCSPDQVLQAMRSSPTVVTETFDDGSSVTIPEIELLAAHELLTGWCGRAPYPGEEVLEPEVDAPPEGDGGN